MRNHSKKMAGVRMIRLVTQNVLAKSLRFTEPPRLMVAEGFFQRGLGPAFLLRGLGPAFLLRGLGPAFLLRGLGPAFLLRGLGWAARLLPPVFLPVHQGFLNNPG
jgi:hypothetical protein